MKIVILIWEAAIFFLNGRAVQALTPPPSLKNCPFKNMVILGPYLTYHSHLVQNGVLKHICTYDTFI